MKSPALRTDSLFARVSLPRRSPAFSHPVTLRAALVLAVGAPGRFPALRMESVFPKPLTDGLEGDSADSLFHSQRQVWGIWRQLDPSRVDTTGVAGGFAGWGGGGFTLPP